MYSFLSIMLLGLGGVYLYLLLHSKPMKKLYRVRWCVTVVHGHSRSSNMVPIKSPRVQVLLVFHCKICLSSIVSGIMIYWSRICIFSPYLPTPVSFEALTRRVPWDL